MTLVHILTRGFVSANARAFLFPILCNEAALRSLGIEYRVFRSIEDSLTDCDVLFVESKYYCAATWSTHLPAILEQLDGFRQRVKQLNWFDNTDSTAALQTQVLPYVDRYYKGQLLRDRSLYRDAWYGGRTYTAYYHRTCGVEDDDLEYSTPVHSDDDLRKLGVSWSMALADYSYSRTRHFVDRACQAFRRWPLVAMPRRWVAPSLDRQIDVSARFGAGHRRATVRYQRERMREKLNGRVPMNRLDRRAYFREMERSKVVLGPFGWGEFSYRDYEAFLSGCVLVKPDMSHLETWPDLYRDGTTILCHPWDMEGLVELIEHVSDNYRDYLQVAVRGQNNYRDYLLGDAAGERFAKRFASTLH